MDKVRSILSHIGLNEHYSNSLNSDELLQPSNLIEKNNYSYITLPNTLYSSEDSYESWNDYRNNFSLILCLPILKHHKILYQLIL